MKSVVLVAASIVLAAMTAQAGGQNKGEEIRVMTYNVENLFDTKHDAGKDDWEYTPFGTKGKEEGCLKKSARRQQRCLTLDWDNAKLNIKLKQVKKIVTQFGDLPDVLALQEVENLNVLKKLSRVLGYDQIVHEEGPDRRGIDVALMYNKKKLRYVGHEARTLTGKEFITKPTRDILGVYFEPKSGKRGQTLAVYVNHWPSQAAPASKRVLTAKGLKEFMMEDKRRFGSGYHAIVTGDFNSIHADHPHPIKSVVLSYLQDAYRVARAGKQAARPQPLGTYFYPPKMTWDQLDRFFISKNMTNDGGIEVVSGSYKIGNAPFSTHTFKYGRKGEPLEGSQVTGVPIRYNWDATDASNAGFSDHFPVTVKVRFQ